jgi:uncharacterized protein YkwD
LTRYLKWLLLLSLAGCSWLGPAGQAQSQAESSGGEAQVFAVQPLSTEQAGALGVELVIQANRARAAANRRPLVAHAALVEAAAFRSGDMAELGYFDHVHPLRGTAEIERLLRPRIASGRIAELLYLNDCEPEQLAELALQAWLADPENRQVLLDPAFNLVGASAARGEAGLYAVLVLTEEG